MSFYGGRPGKSFTIDRIFKNFVEMYNEANNTPTPDTELHNYYITQVPVGAFVMISYGSGRADEKESEYYKNRKEELDWFALDENKHLRPQYNSMSEQTQAVWEPATGDYNANVWYDMLWGEGSDYNATVWIKRWKDNGTTAGVYYYEYIANVAGIVPEIDANTGNWTIGSFDTGYRAAAREVEFRETYGNDTGTLSLIYKKESAVVFSAEEAEETITYALADLNATFIDEAGTPADEGEVGEYIIAYLSNERGQFVSDEDGQRINLGFIPAAEWQVIAVPNPEFRFRSDRVEWRLAGLNDNAQEDEWKSLWETTDYNNVLEYMVMAARSATDAATALEKAEQINEDIKSIKEDIAETSEKLLKAVTEAQGYAETVEGVYNDTKDLLESIVPGVDSADLIAAEVAQARGAFPYLTNRLDNMPYQFDLITDMQKCDGFSQGDKAFTFGMDEVGDDDSKLFQLFDPGDEEDKAKLDEIDEDSITEQNPTGDKKIKEQYETLSIGPNGVRLVAGLLTVFSGKGSGGGGGGGTVGSITTDVSEATVKSGEAIQINYFWTSPNAGQGTLFVKDSASNSVLDSSNANINYTLGVKVSQGNGSIVWRPADGVHNLTFYVIDRGGIYTNEATVVVTAGGIEIVSAPKDGMSYASNQQITLSYGVKTIYKTDIVCLQYETYKDGSYVPELSGTKEADYAATSVTIPIVLKTSDKDIGTGQFRVVVTAHMKKDPSQASDPVTRNFVIAELNKIYLTTTFDSNVEQYALKPFFIPMTLIYSGGSVFTVKGKYTTDKNNWDTALDLGTGTETRAGSFVYPAQFAEPGTYYVKFTVTGKGISATGESEIIEVKVSEASEQYHLQQTGALMLNLSARQGQTNGANQGRWDNMVTTNSGEYATLVNFNYSSNGWEADANKIPTGYLYCNSRTYVSINTNIFKNFYPTGQGGDDTRQSRTIECVFKAADIGLNQTVFDYSIDPAGLQGLFIYKDKAIMNIGNEVQNLTARFNPTGIDAKDAAVHIAFVIDGVNRYAKIFINGVLSAAAEIPLGATSFAPVGEKVIYLNRDSAASTYGVCKVDAVRVYNTALTDDEILKNYVYNLRDSDLQRKTWTQNALDNDALIATDIPYMTFYLNKHQWETMTKDVKHEIRIDYHDPKIEFEDENGMKTHDITWLNAKTNWQGTSSIAYPVKNFKFKLGKDANGKKQKFDLGGKTFKENTFCLKADYMDSSHVHNTGNANFIHESGLLTKYSLTPPQSEELGLTPAQGMKGLPEGVDPGSLKTRTTIYGYPIVLYIALETDESAAIADNDNRQYENPMFWGIYNFNLDKSSFRSLGLFREDPDVDNLTKYQDCTSFEIAANTAYSGGGFRMIKFAKNKLDGSYGWTRPNVYYSPNEDGVGYGVDLINGTFLQISVSDENGKVSVITQTLTDTIGNKVYTGIYNDNLGIKGFSDLNERYDGQGALDAKGMFVKLYKIDPVTLKIMRDTDGKPVLLSNETYDYYTDETQWSKNVPLDMEKYEPIENWEVIDLPSNLDFYYDYYIQDFELRFPDMDAYLCNIDGNEKYNKLFYKEYDKIIALVEWVDSHPLIMNNDEVIQSPGPDGKTFTDSFTEHFDKSTALSYYLGTITVGLIDNFGKNLMIDTWGHNKNGEVPYLTKTFGDKTYHCVWKYVSYWDEDEEYYTDEGSFIYGLMDINNPIEQEDGSLKYNVYESNGKYDMIIGEEPLELADWGNIDGDRTVGWYHEIDITQIVWYPHFYDLDSCLGVNNSGVLLFTPSIEMNDTSYIDAVSNDRIFKAPFNTSDSALWSKMVRGFSNEIASHFRDLNTTQGILTIDQFKKFYYTNAISTMGERWYNADAYPKYLSRTPIKVVINGVEQYRYPKEFIHIAYGNDWQRISTWLTQRMSYLSSMFERTSNNNEGSIEFRGSEVGKDYEYQIECYEPMYMRIIPKNGAKATYKRVDDYNGIVNLSAGQIAAADQEMYILPASNIKKIREINKRGFSSVKPAYASRLLELNLEGSAALETITWAQGDSDSDGGAMATNLMQSINLKNCEKYNGTIQGSSFPLLHTVDLSGTKAGITFNSNGGIIREAKLSSATANLNIFGHYDLENVSIEVRYPDGVKATNVQSGHDTFISSFDLVNCPKINLTINAKVRDTLNTKWIDADATAKNDINTFIKDYGILAMFQNINKIKIENALQIEEVDNIRELKLSLSKLESVSIANSNIDKISLIANTYAVKGANNTLTTEKASYPGTGGDPSLSDADYISTTLDGLRCDNRVTILEIKGPNPETSNTAEFELPWRVHLGSLEGLQELKFDVGTVSVKKINPDSPNISNSALLGIGNGNNVPKRFELILPAGGVRIDNEGNPYPGFELFYVNPSIQTMNFTCVRQSGVDYIGASASTPVSMIQSYSVPGYETQKYFSGIDIRGYGIQNLAMNFKGFAKVTGILGMESVKLVETDGAISLVSYFEGCKALKELYYSSGDANVKWNFANGAYSWYSKPIISTSRMFAGCTTLGSDYVSGFKDMTNLLENASYMFLNCNGLTSMTLNWDNGQNNLSNIVGLFENCRGLKTANIKIENVTKIKSLANLFQGCVSLIDPIVNLTTFDSESGKDISAMKDIEDVSRMFYECESLVELDMAEQEWDFDNLLNASEWFGNCKKLQRIITPDNLNMTNVMRLDNAFNGCAELINIFNHSEGLGWRLYDPEVSKSPLSISNMFSGCSKLEDIREFINMDLSRVDNAQGLFSACTKLRGSSSDGANYSKNILDISKWHFNNELNSAAVFQGCQSLKSVILPQINAIATAGMFNNCTSLTDLDVSAINTSKAVNMGSTFEGCSSLTNLTGYQNWDVKQTTTVAAMFKGCSRLDTIDLSNWRLFGVVGAGINSMFSGCSSLHTIKGLRDIFGDFEAAKNVVNGYADDNYTKKTLAEVNEVFSGCAMLRFTTPLSSDEEKNEIKCDMRNWGPALSKITSMSGLFKGCRSLTSVDAVFGFVDVNGNLPSSTSHPEWKVRVGNPAFSNLQKMDEMFADCTSLVTCNYMNINQFSLTRPTLTTISNMFSGCTNIERLMINGTNMSLENLSPGGTSGLFNDCSKLIYFAFNDKANLKQSLDLSDLNNLDESAWGDISLADWLYDFKGKGEVASEQNYEGHITLAKAPQETMGSLYGQIVGAITAKGWTIGGK